MRSASIFVGLLLALFASTASFAQSAPAPQPPPRCMIDATFGNFHTGTSALGDTVAMLWCDDQLGLDWWVAAGAINPTLSPPACLTSLPPPSFNIVYLQSIWTACMTTAQPLTPDDDAVAVVLFKQFLPRLAVTGPAPQNLYTMKGDGTKGPQLVIGGFGMQVAPGTPCLGRRLQKAGARYHQLGGKTTTNGQTIPSNTFAICTITYPPAGGFTN